MLAAAILAIAGGVLFFRYRSYFNQDRVIAQFPADTIAYAYVREPHAFLNAAVVKRVIGFPEVNRWSDELLRQPFGIGIVPESKRPDAPMAIVVALERTTGDQYELVRSLEHAGYAVAENTKPLLRRTVVVVSSSSAAIERVREVMALRERSLSDDYAAVLGLQSMSAYPAKITVNSIAAVGDMRTRALFAALRLAGLKRATFGIKPAGEWLGFSSNAADAVRDFAASYPDHAVVSVTTADDFSLGRIMRAILRTDAAVYAQARAAITTWEQILGLSLETDIMPYISRPAVHLTEDGSWSASWKYPDTLSPADAASVFGSRVSSILSIAYPIKRSLALRDGSVGLEWAKNTSLTPEHNDFPDRLRLRWHIPDSSIPRQVDIIPATHEARFIEGEITPVLVSECGFPGAKKTEVLSARYNLANLIEKIIAIGSEEHGKTYYSFCFH